MPILQLSKTLTYAVDPIDSAVPVLFLPVQYSVIMFGYTDACGENKLEAKNKKMVAILSLILIKSIEKFILAVCF